MQDGNSCMTYKNSYIYNENWVTERYQCYTKADQVTNDIFARNCMKYTGLHRKIMHGTQTPWEYISKNYMIFCADLDISFILSKKLCFSTWP